MARVMDNAFTNASVMTRAMAAATKQALPPMHSASGTLAAHDSSRHLAKLCSRLDQLAAAYEGRAASSASPAAAQLYEKLTSEAGQNALGSAGFLPLREFQPGTPD